MHSLRTPLALGLTLVVSASAHAQVTVATVLPRDREIELAIAAAPPDVGSKAAVYVFTSKGYEKARDGENGFTCLVNRDSELEGYHVLKPTCWDARGSRDWQGRQSAILAARHDLCSRHHGE